MKSYKITKDDYVKACRKASREEEIALYGKQIYHRHVIHKSKKQYNRMRDRKIPYFFYKSLKIFVYLLYIIIIKKFIYYVTFIYIRTDLGSY